VHAQTVLKGLGFCGANWPDEEHCPMLDCSSHMPLSNYCNYTHKQWYT